MRRLGVVFIVLGLLQAALGFFEVPRTERPTWDALDFLGGALWAWVGVGLIEENWHRRSEQGPKERE